MLKNEYEKIKLEFENSLLSLLVAKNLLHILSSDDEFCKKYEANHLFDFGLINRVDKATVDFGKLIEEHFSNPPLSWDEIKRAEPVFDDEEFGWIFIKYKDPSSKSFEYVDVDGGTGWIKYKENRFYKKEPVEVAVWKGY